MNICLAVFAHVCVSVSFVPAVRLPLPPVWQDSGPRGIGGNSAGPRWSGGGRQAERRLVRVLSHGAAAAAEPSVPREITRCEAPPTAHKHTCLTFVSCMTGIKKRFPDALCHIVTFRESQRKCSCTCVQLCALVCVCVFPPSLARRAHPRARGRPSEGRGAMCHLPDTSTHTITPTWVWATIWCQDSTTSIKVHSMSSCYCFLLGKWFYALFWSEVWIATWFRNSK